MLPFSNNYYRTFAANHVEDFTCAAINLSKAKGGAYRKLGVNAVPTFIAYRDGERVDERWRVISP